MLKKQGYSSGSQNPLEEVLRKATMDDRTVILTVVSQSYANFSSGKNSILDIFLESFNIGEGTKPLLNHLVIIASDKGAFDYCKSIHHPHCLFSLNASWSRNYKIFGDVIQLGYNFIYTVSFSFSSYFLSFK